VRSAPERCGPYGDIGPDGVRRLTDDGRRWLSEWLATHPEPMGLAWKCLRRRVKAALRQGVTVDDVASVVNAATVKAATIYDPASGNKFSSLLVRVIESDLRTYHRDLSRRNDHGRLIAGCMNDGEGEQVDGRCPPVDVDTADLLATARRTVFARCGLSVNETRAVVARLGLDSGEPEELHVVAERHGLERHTCSRLVREAVERCCDDLRRILTPHGQTGEAVTPGRGKPRNHLIRLDCGRRVIVPAGNVRPDTTTEDTP